MLSSFLRSRQIPIALLLTLVPALHAQNCTGTISANVTSVSLSTGGVQQIALSVAPAQVDLGWQILGAFGTNNPTPPLANAGLNLNFDRYMLRMLNGHGGFVHGGINGFLGGPLVSFDLLGNAQLQVVIPSGMPSAFIGRTLHHGMYRTDPINLLPACGTATVSLMLLP